MKTVLSHPYDRSSLLTLNNPTYVKDLERFVLGAYESDQTWSDKICARAHESAMEMARRQGAKVVKAEILAKSRGIFCGEMEARWFLKCVAPRVKCEFFAHDGGPIKPGTPLLRLSGNAETIFKVERTLLNTIQRLSGIATLTAEFVKRVERYSPRSCRVAATRKTLYGLLDKRSVAVGGGLTHRLTLHDAPMFKTNHLKLLKFDWNKLMEELAALPRSVPFVTIEVTSFDQARAILEKLIRLWQEEGTKKKFLSKFFLLFDNFTPRDLKSGIFKLKKPKNVYFEASGGITLDNISAYAKAGVDVISVGALTHSVKAMDFSLKIR